MDSLRESKLRPILEKLLPIMCMSAWGMVPEGLELSFPPLWTPTAKEVSEIARTKAETVIAAFQAGLVGQDTAQKELKKLAEETGMFDSISDEEIRRNKGKSFQDVTSLRDPLMGLPFESPESEEPDPFELAAQDSLAEDFDPDQPRDKDGKWTKGGGFGGNRGDFGKSGMGGSKRGEFGEEGGFGSNRGEFGEKGGFGGGGEPKVPEESGNTASSLASSAKTLTNSASSAASVAAAYEKPRGFAKNRNGEKTLDKVERKRYDNLLLGEKTSNGVTIKSLSEHAYDRAAQRELSPGQIKQALQQPPKQSIKDPSCLEFDSGKVRVVVNQNTGNIVSVMWKNGV